MGRQKAAPWEKRLGKVEKQRGGQGSRNIPGRRKKRGARNLQQNNFKPKEKKKGARVTSRGTNNVRGGVNRWGGG